MFETQSIIVFLVIGAAAFYFGATYFRKAKSFSSKTSCGDDCGCDGAGKHKN